MDFLGDIFSHLPEDTPAGGHRDMVFSVGGEEYAIPNPDGLDSATFTSDEGMTIVSDLDGDGHVDYISNVSFDGRWTAWRPEMGGENGKTGTEQSTDRGNSGEITPDEVSKSWNIGEWECVDRGEWG